MFQILEPTYARLATITPRVEKHGDDNKPAVTLKLEIEAANTMLDAIDPQIRHALYAPKPDAEPELPGVEVSTPILRCNSFEKHALTTAVEGWTLAVDYGIEGDEKPMLFGGCKVDKLTVDAKQGGSIVLAFRVGTSDIDAKKIGMLAMRNGEEIVVTLKAPEKKPDAIDGTVGHRGAAASQPSAEDLFAAGGDGTGDPEDDSEGGDPDIVKVGPFDELPGDADAETPPPGTSKRTARGRDRTKAALAAGAAQ